MVQLLIVIAVPIEVHSLLMVVYDQVISVSEHPLPLPTSSDISYPHTRESTDTHIYTRIESEKLKSQKTTK